MGRGLTTDGTRALHDVLATHVERGDMPGVVALVACGDDVHIETIGHQAFGDATPMARDTIFRIASVTKPIAGVAAMLLIEGGEMALDDPVARWLPELAEPRVLRTIESELDDTVPAERAITVEDVLSFHLGWGSLMAPPDTYPIQRVEAALDLNTFGPPWPPSAHTPDTWVAGLAGLPLLDQPGAGWRYAGGAQVAGVLIERVASAPIADVLRDLVFEPLGMDDTGFFVPPDQRHRFATQYEPDPDTGELHVLDRPDGWWSAPPSMPDANGWLVSTVDDLWVFASMMRANGAGLLAPESLQLMTVDRMTAEERAENQLFVGDHIGWGLMMGVPAGDGTKGIPGGFGWDGGTGTSWRTDPDVDLTGILLTQRSQNSPEPPEVVTDFWAAAYAAIGDARV